MRIETKRGSWGPGGLLIVDDEKERVSCLVGVRQTRKCRGMRQRNDWLGIEVLTERVPKKKVWTISVPE